MSTWELRDGVQYALRVRELSPTSRAWHYQVRWSYVTKERPVADHYCTMHVAVVQHATGGYEFQCRFEQDESVHDESRLASGAAQAIIDGHIVAKRKIANEYSGILGLVEDHDGSRLPKEYAIDAPPKAGLA